MATSIDQQFVEYIVRSLVNNPDGVKVDRRIDEKGVLLELTVDADDLGRVIGKRGATAQSLRTLLRALGTKNEARYNLKIVDVDRPESERNMQQPSATATSSDDDDDTEEDTQTTTKHRTAVNKEVQPEADNGSVEPLKPANDTIARTRKELAELDDLDI
ncbi:MAG TPA: KH domain-containing protein [Verrucomicrobiae bacterium]|nr:KH domain-containing protein [Verrucomicrobiae bacterium]